MTDNSEHPRPGVIPGAAPGPAPAPGAPGMIPGAQPPAPGNSTTPVGPGGYTLAAPTSLAKALIGVAIAYAVVTVISAAFAAQDANALVDTLTTGEFSFSPGMAISALAFPLLVTSFILYGVWATRLRRNRAALGDRPGLGGVEWWGWFVPIAFLVLVPLGLHRVAGRKVSGWLIAAWAIAWNLAGLLSGIAGVLPQAAVDLSTGDLTRPELLDSYAPLMQSSAAITLVALGLFILVIRQATARTLDR